MRRFIITEEEKYKIKGLYGLINEAIDPNSGGTVTIDNFYKAGWYGVDTIDNKTKKKISDTLKVELDKVTEFVRLHPDSIVEVTFKSGESAKPNKDNEGKEGGGFLGVNELSKLRRKYLEPFIQTYFQTLKDQGYIGKTVEVPPINYIEVPPKTPWVSLEAGDSQSKFCPAGSSLQAQRSTCVIKYRELLASNDSGILKLETDYNTEQFSQITITVKLKSSSTTETTTIPQPNCAANLKIRVFVPSHNCQNAEFFIFANSTLLYNTVGGYTANLNNSNTDRGIPKVGSSPTFPSECLNPGFGYLPNGDGTYGGYRYGSVNSEGDTGAGRSDTFIVTETQSANIVRDGKGKIVIWMIGTTSNVHVDRPIVQIMKGDKIVYNKKPKFTKGKLITLDACGDKDLNEVDDDTTPDVSGYIAKLKNDKIAVLQKIEVGDNKLTDKQRRKKEKALGGNLDGKAQLLERAQQLNDDLLSLLKTIKPLFVDKTKKNDVYGMISQSYKNFYTLINQEPSFAQDVYGNYTNKFIDKDELAGDLRMMLDDFYEGFNIIYYDNDEGAISPTGNPSYVEVKREVNKYMKEHTV